MAPVTLDLTTVMPFRAAAGIESRSQLEEIHNVMSLDTLGAGGAGRLIGIGGERAFRCRLMELGLLPGAVVRVVRRSDRGGVLELEVRGCRLSVRRGEASQLMIEAL